MNGLARLARSTLQAGVAQALPARCGVCGTWDSLLCSGCRDGLPRVEDARCGLCWQASTLPTCPSCIAYGPPCTAVRAPFRYEGGVRPLIGALKYRGVSAYAAPLGELLALAWPAYDFGVDLIVPVPLHPRRDRWRGYNQSALLASELARAVGLPVRSRALARIRPTPPQARTTSAAERAGHMLGAFSCIEPGAVRGREIMLIDDVTTSGATLRACSSALFAAGARAVYGYTFALA